MIKTWGPKYDRWNLDLAPRPTGSCFSFFPNIINTFVHWSILLPAVHRCISGGFPYHCFNWPPAIRKDRGNIARFFYSVFEDLTFGVSKLLLLWNGPKYHQPPKIPSLVHFQRPTRLLGRSGRKDLYSRPPGMFTVVPLRTDGTV